MFSVQRHSTSATMPPILTLPADMISSTLQCLPTESIHACILTNQTFNKVTKQESFWKQLYIRDYAYRYGTENPASTYFQAYTTAYRFNFYIQRGIYSSKVLYSWNNPFESVKCTHIRNEKLFIGCLNGTLIIKNITTGETLRRIQEPRDPPHALGTSGDVLYVGYASGAVKAWNTETGDCLNTFKENIGQGLVLRLITCKEKVIVSYSHHVISIWDTHTNLLIKTLNKGTKDPLFKTHSLAVYKNHLFAGDIFGRSKIWNMETWDEVFNGTSIEEFTRVRLSLPNEREVYACFNFFDVNSVPEYKNMLSIYDPDRHQTKSFEGHEENVLLAISAQGVPIPINRDGKLLIENKDEKRIVVFNFDVDQKNVMREIVDQFRSGNPAEIFDANNRFLRMPRKTTNKVYQTLCREIYDPSRIALNRYPNSDLHLQALYSSVWHKSSPSTKAQAILNSDPSLAQNQEQWEGPARCEKKQKK